MAVTSAQIQELYIGYFGRPADQAGLNYWLGATNAANSTVTLNDIRSSFAQQTEYTTLYPSTQTRAQTVTAIYENLFGRTPADNEVGYWTFTSANTPVQNLIQAFLESASASDRAIVDAKAAFAQTVTDTYGSSSNGTTGISAVSTAYQNVITATAADQNVSNPPAYIDSLNSAIATASKSLNFDGTNYNAFGNASASLTVAADATVPASLVVNGDQLTSFTLAHDYANTTSNGGVAFGAGGSAADNITSLTLNLTHASVTESSTADDVALNLANLSALTTLNASGSNVDLTVTNVPATLTNITLGSGDDSIIVTTGTTATAKVVAVAAGAGNDTITANVNAANVQINAGAGDDTVNLNIQTAAGASQGNHGAEIALGAGNDKLVVTGANVQFYTGSDAAKASQLAAAAVKVTDFAAGDSVSIATITATKGTADFSTTDLATFNAATTLAGKLDAAATLLGNNTTSMHFEFNGNTYVYADTAGAGAFGAGDTLIELTGATGLANSSFAV